jgi:DNA-binding response OmpR family regulator
MPRVLIVDDEQALRNLLRDRLKDGYEIIETGDSTEALALALEHKPECILLDLMMPGHTGFELCQTLSSLTATQLIPIIVISAHPATEYRDYCLNLGAREYFEKPVNFNKLKARLAEVLKEKQKERRNEVRARLRAILKLTGSDRSGKAFELLTVSENVSVSGFLCGCHTLLEIGATVEVALRGGGGVERQVGRARVVRVEWLHTPAQRYGFLFVDKPRDWILK